MKLFKVMTLIVSVLCCVKLSNAQDVIVMKDNKTILRKVTKVSQTEIEYKKWSDQDGPTYIINKSEVSNINYENGERDIFDSQTGHPDAAKTMMRVGRNLMLDNKLLTDEIEPFTVNDSVQHTAIAKQLWFGLDAEFEFLIKKRPVACDGALPNG